MIKFGIIGTNFIVDNFIEATKLISEISITSLYSRTNETGTNFCKKHSIPNLFTNIDDMIASNTIDAIYIASPNSLHFSQSIKFLQNKIAVLCEKPLASNEKEVSLMIRASKENNTLLMEAFRPIHNPKFKFIKEKLKEIEPIRSVFANFCQYSSRYNKYKEGIILNAFNPDFSSGSTMDIGLYPVYLVTSLLGFPKKIESQNFILNTGVDGSGCMLLKYDEFSAIINHSKISNSFIASEIAGEKGNIIIEKIATLEKIFIKYPNGEEETILIDDYKKNDMYYEILHFITLLKNNEIESFDNPLCNSLKVIRILESSRKQNGIIFKADKKI